MPATALGKKCYCFEPSPPNVSSDSYWRGTYLVSADHVLDAAKPGLLADADRVPVQKRERWHVHYSFAAP